MKPTLKCRSACLVCHCTQSFVLFGVKNLHLSTLLSYIDYSSFDCWFMLIFSLQLHEVFCQFFVFFIDSFSFCLCRMWIYTFTFKNYLIFWDLFSLCSSECLRTHVDQTDLPPPNARIKGAYFFSHMVYSFTCFSVAVIVTMTEKASWGRKVYLDYNLVCHWGKPEQKLKAGTEAGTIQESCSVNFLIGPPSQR